jgi:hypothetical protein
LLADGQFLFLAGDANSPENQSLNRAHKISSAQPDLFFAIKKLGGEKGQRQNRPFGLFSRFQN